MNNFCLASFVLTFLFSSCVIHSTLFAQDLGHRMSSMKISVEDQNGNAISNATVDVRMTRHAFQFGSQVRDRLYTISQSEFDSLSVSQRQGLLESSNTTFTPDWQDVLNYRDAVHENFNHVIPTNGMQWIAYKNNGPSNPDAAILQAQANGMTVTGHAVVWGNDGWPTPTEFRPGANPDAQEFHDALIAERLGSNGIMTRYSDTGVGPTVTDWDVLNEPLNERYYSTTFANAGIYANENEARTDFFIRANNLRPDASLAINEYNILNSSGDGNANAYRDLVNSMLGLGAPIDKIKVQAHMGVSGISKSDLTRRLDILAETGLPIVISEFDMRDDANQLSNAEQKQLFQDILEASFEHESVEGFNMWGFWDAAHWRGNGPLFDDSWAVKDESSAWFDLVRGEWMTELNSQALDGGGMWIGDVIDGTYEFDVTQNGVTQTYSGYELTEDGEFLLTFNTVPEPSSLLVVCMGALGFMGRRRGTIGTAS